MSKLRAAIVLVVLVAVVVDSVPINFGTLVDSVKSLDFNKNK